MKLFFAWVLAYLPLLAAPTPPALRLPRDVEPQRIALDLTLDPKLDTYKGSIRFDLKVNNAVDHFWLNATDLQIATAELEQAGKTRKAQVVAGGEDFTGFHFDAPLTPGSAALTVSFAGKVNLRSSEGVFRSSNGADQFLFTQFEPIDARRAFPCFDEPGFKIPWQLTLHVPQQQVAVANTGVEQETPEAGGMKAVRFRETKPLPSYLIAFAVGPLEFVEGGYTGSRHVPVRIVVPRGEKDRARYAASISAEILNRLEQYFGIPYPYDKSDQLAVPVSFGGAMENPGLVTYDADIILSPPGQDTDARQRKYAEIAAHELAHQWFGDMVTMAWWNDVWLNESFATWMSARLIADWKPEWKTRSEDQTERLRAIGADMVTSARRINQPAESKNDIGDAFDYITYQKGGSVLAMFENAVGPEKFQRGVHAYLNDHLFGNARAEDFLEAIGRASSPEYAAAFSTFLNQNGVPLVKVDLRCEGAPRVHVDQQRLLPVGSAGSTEATWNIPLCFAYGDGAGRHQTCTLLKAKQSDVSLGSRSCPAWLLANSKEVGYYEVAYTDEALRKLVDNRHQLTLAEQVGLFGDVASLAQAGAVPYAQSLSLVPRLAADPAREIVQAAIKLATVPHQYIPIDLQKSYQDFVVQTFGARARQLGWTAKSGEPADDKLLRVALLRFVARRGEDPVLVRNAQELAQKWLRDHRVVGPDVAEILLGTAAEHGGRELFDQFLAAAKAEQDNYYKPILIASLGYFRQPELVSQAFQVATDGTFDVRFTSALMGAQTGERGSSEVVYQYIKNHYDAILRNMPTGIGTEYASYLPQFAAYGGCTAALHDDMEQFFHDRMQKVQGGPRGLAKALESVKLCTAQQPAAQQSLRAFLERGGTKADRSTLVRK